MNPLRQCPKWILRAEKAGLRIQSAENSFGWGFVPAPTQGEGEIYVKISIHHSEVGEWPEGLRGHDLQLIRGTDLEEVYKWHNIPK